MKRYTKGPTTFNQSHLWPGLLALVLFVLQPLLLSLQCGPVSAHSHFEGQVPHHVNNEESAIADLHRDTNYASHRPSHHGEHHNEVDGHDHQPQLQQNHAVQTIALHGMSVSSDHRHEICCSHSDAPMVAASTSSRLGANEGDRVPVAYAAVIAPVFHLDVASGIRSRAGPSHTPPLYSQFLRSTLLGRAPPRSV